MGENLIFRFTQRRGDAEDSRYVARQYYSFLLCVAASLRDFICRANH
jgi:hypothetical protein